MLLVSIYLNSYEHFEKHRFFYGSTKKAGETIKTIVTLGGSGPSIST